MGKGIKALVGVAVVAGIAVGGYYVVRLVLDKKSVVDEAVASVQSQLDELDPVSRAAAVAKLTADEAKSLRPTKA
ncbi:MAG: hypothetical protein LCI03_08560 [Actinobacteria bacterium]|jgi:uncharacterized ion transporter superfamily protein YfcC|nr:hypothetical protein [Actinomycetota bacterium]